MMAEKTSLKAFVRHEAAGAAVLVLAACAGLAFANSPLSDVYAELLTSIVEISVGGFSIQQATINWINNSLMALFFFLVGLESKREIVQGELRGRRALLLPGVAAAAGIVVPAAIYVGFNFHDSASLRGWAIASATDIVFALGVLRFFGRRIAPSLRVFLLSIAVLDDLASVVIIGLFYSHSPPLGSVVGTLAVLGAMYLLSRFSVRATGLYLVLGLAVWLLVLKSGVHASIAGFMAACFVPLNVENRSGQPMATHLEERLAPWVDFLILPLFAFANAGILINRESLTVFDSTVFLGIAVGLVIGKPLGVFGACWLTIRSGWARLPEGASYGQLFGVAVLCGIGFTMSLFISSLAFLGQEGQHEEQAKLAILVASLVSAVLGSLLIARKTDSAGGGD